MLSKIFGWWEGATIGTRFTIAKRGEHVGTDEFGNKYYEAKDHSSYDGRKRRWVVYEGYADATKVSPDWHGWLRYTFDLPPTEAPLLRRPWEKDHLPNLTGTPMAWRPQGSLAAEAKRVLQEKAPNHPYLAGNWPDYPGNWRKLNPFAGEKSALDMD